mgnify:CR=1 FL=1
MSAQPEPHRSRDADERIEVLIDRVRPHLTDREAELFAEHVRGASPAELARRLGYPSAGTVRLTLNRIRWYIADALPRDREVRALITRASR